MDEGPCAGLVVKPEALEIRKDNYMRRYCKSIDIQDIKFIKKSIRQWLKNKKSRRDVQHFLSMHSSILTYREIQEHIINQNYEFLDEIIDKIALDVQRRIINQDLELPEIQFKRRFDTGCNKWRVIGIQKPIHQIMDYIAVRGCEGLFKAKIGQYQMASIPGRGQEAGVRTILKWLELDAAHTRYYVKGDVKQCYPSISHDKLKKMFARDVKNSTLLWLIYELIDAFPQGLSIGSYFSQYACNYYLSKSYHYASEQLYRERKKRDGSVIRTRLIFHVLYYMDDFIFLGSSKKDVAKAMDLMIKFMKQELGLEVKDGWRVYETDYIGKDGKHHGQCIDMMGYRIWRNYITIRRRTFKRARRTILRAGIKIDQDGKLPLKIARRVISHNGRFEHSNSYRFSAKYNLNKIAKVAKYTISEDAKQKNKEKERRCG